MAANRHSVNLIDPAEDVIAVTPSDSVDLVSNSKAIIVAVGGALKLTTVAGNTSTITVPAGQFSIRATRIWSTGTTATGITALV